MAINYRPLFVFNIEYFSRNCKFFDILYRIYSTQADSQEKGPKLPGALTARDEHVNIVLESTKRVCTIYLYRIVQKTYSKKRLEGVAFPGIDPAPVYNQIIHVK
jgi:hypothetical protein